MEIEPVRAGDEAAVRAWWAAMDAAQRLDAPWLPTDPLEESLLERDSPRRGYRLERWATRINGQVVGGLRVELPMLDNTEAVAVELFVDPRFRRRGVGRALLDQVARRAREESRPLVIAEMAEPLDRTEKSAGAAFAAAVGAQRALSEVCRILDLDAVPEERAAALQREAELRSSDYELVQWIGPAPEDALDDLSRLQVLLSIDAPLEDLRWEPEVWDADRVREQERDDADKGRTPVATAARHTSSGRIVAYSDILVSHHRPELGHQGTTIVEQKHRGHSLGLLVKAANLRQLRASQPDVRRVVTWNAEVNRHMVAINETLGFTKVGRWSEWQLDVPPASSA